MVAIVYPGFTADEPTAAGRALVTAVDAMAQRSLLGLGFTVADDAAVVHKSGDEMTGTLYLPRLQASGGAPLDVTRNGVHAISLNAAGFVSWNGYGLGLTRGDTTVDAYLYPASVGSVGIYQTDGTTLGTLQASGVVLGTNVSQSSYLQSGDQAFIGAGNGLGLFVDGWGQRALFELWNGPLDIHSVNGVNIKGSYGSGYGQLTAGAATFSGPVTATGTNQSDIRLLIKGVVSQLGHLTRWVDATDATLAFVNSAGVFNVPSIQIGADGSSSLSRTANRLDINAYDGLSINFGNGAGAVLSINHLAAATFAGSVTANQMSVTDTTAPVASRYLIYGEGNYGRKFGFRLLAGGDEGGVHADSVLLLAAGGGINMAPNNQSPGTMLYAISGGTQYLNYSGMAVFENANVGPTLVARQRSGYTSLIQAQLADGTPKFTVDSAGDITAGAATFGGNVTLSTAASSLTGKTARFTGDDYNANMDVKIRTVTNNPSTSVGCGIEVGSYAGHITSIGYNNSLSFQIYGGTGAVEAITFNYNVWIRAFYNYKVITQGDGGLSVRNFADDGDAPLTASTGTFSGAINGASFGSTTIGGTYGSILLKGGVSVHNNVGGMSATWFNYNETGQNYIRGSSNAIEGPTTFSNAATFSSAVTGKTATFTCDDYNANTFLKIKTPTNNPSTTVGAGIEFGSLYGTVASIGFNNSGLLDIYAPLSRLLFNYDVTVVGYPGYGLLVYGDTGVKVRNRDNTANGPITAGAATLSSITCPWQAGDGTGEQFGYGAATSQVAVAIGRGANNSAAASVSVGYNATSTYAGVGIGYAASAGWSGVAIGFGASSQTTYAYGGVAVGYYAFAHDTSIAIGNVATSGPNQCYLGSNATMLLRQSTSARWTQPATGQRNSEVGDGSGSVWQTGYREEYNASGIRCGFYNATPVARQEIDSGSATLAADLLAALTNLGLVQTL